MAKSDSTTDAFCWFCGESYLKVGPLVEGPGPERKGGVFICSGCAQVCLDTLDQERDRRNTITWKGPPSDDKAILDRLPEDLRDLLLRINGFIQFGGGLHVRGASSEPWWHSLRHAWDSEDALCRNYSNVRETDIPFAQDALGDQFLLRDGHVVKLSAESDDIEPLGIRLNDFLQRVQDDPIGFLELQPLQHHWQLGGQLQPGQLLSVLPPFVVDAGDTRRSYRAISALDRLGFLAGLARQIRELPEGARIRFDVS